MEGACADHFDCQPQSPSMECLKITGTKTVEFSNAEEGQE